MKGCAGLEPEEFIKKILVDRLGVAAVAAGEGFYLWIQGPRHHRVPAERRLPLGIQSVTTVPSVIVDGEKVSSTRIRGLLQERCRNSWQAPGPSLPSSRSGYQATAGAENWGFPPPIWK